jgi:hypothetical protein
MRNAKTSHRPVASSRKINDLIEEATVDCNSEEEAVTGFLTMIDDNLALPFRTRVLGVEVSVAAVAMGDDGSLKAVCKHGGEQQRICLIDLPLPSPPPSGVEWIAAYRRWALGRWGSHNEEE